RDDEAPVPLPGRALSPLVAAHRGRRAGLHRGMVGGGGPRTPTARASREGRGLAGRRPVLDLPFLRERSSFQRVLRATDRVDARGRERAERPPEHVVDLMPEHAPVERERCDRGRHGGGQHAAETDLRSPRWFPLEHRARDRCPHAHECHPARVVRALTEPILGTLHVDDVPVPVGQVPGVARDLPHALGRRIDLDRVLGRRHPGIVLPLVQPLHHTTRRGVTRTSASADGARPWRIARIVLAPEPTFPSTKNSATPWNIAPTMSRARQADGLSTVSATVASRSAAAIARVWAGSAAYSVLASARQRIGSTTGPRSPATASAPRPSRPICE